MEESVGRKTIEEALFSPEEIDPVLSIDAAFAQTSVLHLFDTHGGAKEQQRISEGIKEHNLEQLTRVNISATAALIAAIRSQKERRWVWPMYPVVGSLDQYRQFPALEDGIWILDSLTYWASPANAGATVSLSLTLDGVGCGIPIPLVLSKTDIATRELGFPITDNVQFSWAAPTGTANDKGIILPRFVRVG